MWYFFLFPFLHSVEHSFISCIQMCNKILDVFPHIVHYVMLNRNMEWKYRWQKNPFILKSYLCNIFFSGYLYIYLHVCRLSLFISIFLVTEVWLSVCFLSYYYYDKDCEFSCVILEDLLAKKIRHKIRHAWWKIWFSRADRCDIFASIIIQRDRCRHPERERGRKNAL